MSLAGMVPFDGPLLLGHAAHVGAAPGGAGGGPPELLLVLGPVAVIALVALLCLPVAQRGAARPTHQGRLPEALAALSALAGAIHAAVVPEHLAEGTSYGVAFLALAVLQLAFAEWLLRPPTPAVLTTSLALNVAVALLWLGSRTTGLPFGPHAFHPEPVGLLDAVCTAAQVVVAAGCLWLLRSLPTPGRRVAGVQAA